MSDYYNRPGGVAADGTPTYAVAADTEAESRVDRIVEAAWGCTVHKLPPLSPIDRYIEKDGRLVAYLEIKTRTHRADRFPDVWLNHRKYMALLNMHLAVGVATVFVVQFTDQIRWVDVSHLTPGSLRMGGTRRLVKSDTDREPMVKVMVADMHQLEYVEVPL